MAVAAPAQERPTASTHLEAIDGLRALTALYVVLFHWVYLLTPVLPGQASAWVLAPFHFGHFAVSIFIVLSGYCLMLSVVRRGYQIGDLKTYVIRRARRLLPPYYAALALALVLGLLLLDGNTVTQWVDTKPITWAVVFSRLFLVQDLYQASRINGVFWSLAVEWRISLLFPLLVLAWRKWGPAATVLGTLVLSFVLAAKVLRTDYYWSMPHYLGLFALGMLAAHVGRAPQCDAWRTRVPWQALSGVCFLALLPVAHCITDHTALLAIDLLVAAFTFCMLVGLTAGRAPLLHRVCSWRPLVVVGGASYSLYLIHWPLEELLWRAGLHHLGPWALVTALTAGTLLIVGAALTFHQLFERPFMAPSLPRTAPLPAPATTTL